MAYRTERRRSSELNLPGSKVQIGAHWKKPFSRIYDSTYGSHGKTYEDLLDPSARSRSADRRPTEYPPHRLAAVPEAASWQPAGGDDFLEMTMPREHLFRPLSVNRNTRSDEVLSIFGVPKVSVPTNYHDQELESYLHKIRQPRDPGLKLAMMERGTRMMDDAALRRATRLTATNTDDLAAEMFSSANLQAMHHEMMS